MGLGFAQTNTTDFVTLFRYLVCHLKFILSLFSELQPDLVIPLTDIGRSRAHRAGLRLVLCDTMGSLETSPGNCEANVFLLCYSFADPGTLFSCLDHWSPELRPQAPATSIILGQ